MGSMNTVEEMAKDHAEKASRPPKPPGRGGSVLPPGGRPVGTKNKTTRQIKDMVTQALERAGGVHYLVKCAHDPKTASAFLSLVGKIVPLQVNANVDGAIKLELSWLGGRSIGTTAAQIEDKTSEIVELQASPDGVLRIKDPVQQDAPSAGVAAEPPQGAGG